MVYLLNLSSQIDIWNKELNDLADQVFDNPFSGMAAFIILLAISMIAIRSFSKR